MGGIWSTSRLAVVTILIAVFWSIISIALRTLARSIKHLRINIHTHEQHIGGDCFFCFSQQIAPRWLIITSSSNKNEMKSIFISLKNAPESVLGVASVTSKVHCSQQTSSSVLENQAFRLRFSKNWTAIWPRTELECRFEVVSICRISAVVRWSINVSSSTSSTTGRVTSRRSRDLGRIEGKYRWKKMVWSIPIITRRSIWAT